MVEPLDGLDGIEQAVLVGLEAEARALAVAPEGAVQPEDDDDTRRSRWQSRRPRIDHLKDGTVTAPDGTTLPLFDVGDRIVVDRRTTFLRGMPWLETIVGCVRSIDDDTGLVTMWDEDGDVRNLAVRYVSFKDLYHIFKLAPAKGNPFDAARIARTKPPLKPGEVRRGRGRPKGSKNRPKDVIKAEKEARQALKRGVQ